MSATAFVTGATGLLGNNLVRLLLERGHAVRALARSPAKAERQFADPAREPVRFGRGPGQLEIVEGDMTDVAGFAKALAGVDVVYHTAAYFRDGYTGGTHWDALYRTNVEGTTRLLEAAYAAGVRRAVHTSSVALLDTPKGAPPDTVLDETMLRRPEDADDYYRSKILSDQAVLAFLEAHPDFHAALVLPAWMFGPGDAGPTSSGQTVLDFARGKLPGVVPGSFSVVDARDVAAALVAAAERGRRGERYLAAGRHMTMADIFPRLAEATGVPAPTRRLPLAMLYALGAAGELYARLTKRPVLLSLATVRVLAREAGRSRYDLSKSERELGYALRPVAETLADTVAWYRATGQLPARPGVPAPGAPRRAAVPTPTASR